MNQSELHWSRWRNEESLHIYQNHVKRCQEVGPCPAVTRRKESANRERYIKHRRAAEAIKRQFEQRRIDKDNKLLEERIALLVADKQRGLSRQKRGGRQKTPRRREDPIKTQELVVANISLLRRIVSAKPFTSRQEWARDRVVMKRYLKRLKRTRDERQGILVQRDELARAFDKLPAPRAADSDGDGDGDGDGRAKQLAKQAKQAMAARPATAAAATTATGTAARPPRTSRPVSASSSPRAHRVMQPQNGNKQSLAEVSHVKNELMRLEQEFQTIFKTKPKAQQQLLDSERQRRRTSLMRRPHHHEQHPEPSPEPTKKPKKSAANPKRLAQLAAPKKASTRPGPAEPAKAAPVKAAPAKAAPAKAAPAKAEPVKAAPAKAAPAKAEPVKAAPAKAAPAKAEPVKAAPVPTVVPQGESPEPRTPSQLAANVAVCACSCAVANSL